MANHFDLTTSSCFLVLFAMLFLARFAWTTSTASTIVTALTFAGLILASIATFAIISTAAALLGWTAATASTIGSTVAVATSGFASITTLAIVSTTTFGVIALLSTSDFDSDHAATSLLDDLGR